VEVVGPLDRIRLELGVPLLQALNPGRFRFNVDAHSHLMFHSAPRAAPLPPPRRAPLGSDFAARFAAPEEPLPILPTARPWSAPTILGIGGSTGFLELALLSSAPPGSDNWIAQAIAPTRWPMPWVQPAVLLATSLLLAVIMLNVDHRGVLTAAQVPVCFALLPSALVVAMVAAPLLAMGALILSGPGAARAIARATHLCSHARVTRPS